MNSFKVLKNHSNVIDEMAPTFNLEMATCMF